MYDALPFTSLGLSQVGVDSLAVVADSPADLAFEQMHPDRCHNFAFADLVGSFDN